jgi:hypothetical protein
LGLAWLELVQIEEHSKDLIQPTLMKVLQQVLQQWMSKGKPLTEMQIQLQDQI